MSGSEYIHRRVLASGIPLGGIGAGSVEIRPDGSLHDWEIFNNGLWSGDGTPHPDTCSEDAFFALRVKTPGSHPKLRFLFDDDKKARAAASAHEYTPVYNFPFLRYIPEIKYRGRHPFAELEYKDDSIPLDIRLKAFSPFIPHNARDSALPLAYFVFSVKNTGIEECDASLMFSLRNLAGFDADRHLLKHSLHKTVSSTSILMEADKMDTASQTWGSMAASVIDPGAGHLIAWSDDRGLIGFENADAPAFGQLVYSMRDSGSLPSEKTAWQREIVRKESKAACSAWVPPKMSMRPWRSALCTKKTLQPGEESKTVFVMSWFFPNHYHYYKCPEYRLGHMYENCFANAMEVSGYGIENFERLHTESVDFRDNLYRGLPGWLADSFNAQLTTFPQSFWWTRNGEFSAWEGSACCQALPAAQTMWSSFQPLLFFPEIFLAMKKKMGDQSMRLPAEPDTESYMDAEIRRKTETSMEKRETFGGWLAQRWSKDGYTEEDFANARSRKHRNQTLRSSWEGATSLLRDYLWTGDRELLEFWPEIRKKLLDSMQYDKNGDGLPDGAICFMTYDHWFLPALNSYQCSLWLAELRAAIRLAEIAGDTQAAEKFSSVLEPGRQNFEKIFWNGEYYNLCRDEKRSLDDRGCMADQVSGHLYLRICGLDPVHDGERTRKALRSVLKYNLKPEEGLLNGSDPEGRDDWMYFARYSKRGEDEKLGGQWVTPWSGTEYFVSAVMISEGLTEEGLKVMKAVYDRQTELGLLYNHIECGEHYFRPMVVWANLHALQGLAVNIPEGELKFAPRLDPDDHDTLLLLPRVWGRITQKRDDKSQVNTISVKKGELTLNKIMLETDGGKEVSQCSVELDSGKLRCTTAAEGKQLTVTLKEDAKLAQGKTLRLRI